MGYYMFSYAIDSSKVRGVIGTKDQDLFDRVLETEEFDLYASQDEKGNKTTRRALEELILGRRHSLFSKYDEASAHTYWYAFIAICGWLGERLPASHEIKLRHETDLIDHYLKSDFGISVQIDVLLLDGKVEVFNLPKVKNWPLCGLWDREQLTRQQQRFAPVEITDDQLQQLSQEDDKKEMAYDSIRQIKENITYCLGKELSMITFCH